MARGIPQGSVLGPLLWNIAFDNILKVEVPPKVSIICYADDILVVTVEDDIPMLKRKVNTAHEATTCWIESAGLNQQLHRRRFSPPFFRIKGGR